MYVLMDMEWYQTWNRNVPVQFGALRINSNWTVIDRYKRLVHPNITGKIKWQSVCFTGATKQEYSSAADLLTVLNDLHDWLKNDDIIFWWHESSENLFREIFMQAFGCPIAEMGVLRQTVAQHLQDGKLNAGSPFKLASARSVPVAAPEHDASNDTMTLYWFLRHLDIPMEQYIAEGCMEPRIDQSCTKKGTSIKVHGLRNGIQFQYLCDPETKTMHVPGCPEIVDRGNLKGFISLRSCIRTLMTPCKCCRDKMDNYLKQSHLEYPMYRRKSSHVIHMASCYYVKHVDSDQKVGYFSIKGACADQCRPCKYCASMEALFRIEQADVKRYCTENDLTFEYKLDGIHIFSRYEIWRIVMNDSLHQPILYHRNVHHRAHLKPNDADLTEFHVQSCPWESFMSYFQYIKKHEAYIAEQIGKGTQNVKKHPHTKRGKKEKCASERRRRCQQIAHVQGLLEELEEG